MYSYTMKITKQAISSLLVEVCDALVDETTMSPVFIFAIGI
nr:unnamed protein product [Callosobruchus analis]